MQTTPTTDRRSARRVTRLSGLANAAALPLGIPLALASLVQAPLVLAPLVLAPLALGGCGSTPRRSAEPETGPTNAGLARLMDGGGTPTLDDPSDEFIETRARVRESARLLEQALAESTVNDPPPELNTEGWESIDVPPSTRPMGRSGMNTAQSPSSQNSSNQQASVANADSGTRGTPTNQGTRFSLSDAGGRATPVEQDPTPPTDTPPTDTKTNQQVGEQANPFRGDQPERQAFDPSRASVGPVGPSDPGLSSSSGNIENQPGQPRIESRPQPTRLDPEQRKQELIDELTGVLTDLARSGSEPGSAALALAGLETLSPSALQTLRDEGVLSPAELTTLEAARSLFDGLRTEGGIADPAQVARVLDGIQRELDAQAGLRVTRAELCTRVTGFGRYETFPNNRFIAGRAQPVIVYTEVAGFAQQQTAGPDGDPRFEIELTQRLELYHTADDLNTWNRAAETDRSVSRNRVRDYYLINQVTLPGNLSIGKYHLKVVMRDRVGGHMAEAIIPIEIVAGTRAGVDF